MLSLLMAFALLILQIPAVALAAPNTAWSSAAAGTAEDPYCISTADDLAGLAQLVNAGNNFDSKYIKLATGTNLDLSAYSNWEPIGTSVNPFKGNFDGNGAILSNLTINDTRTLGLGQSIFLGLFGDVGVGGSINHVTLTGVNIAVTHNYADLLSSRNSFVGAIAGANEGTISNCSVSGSINVSGIDVIVGGIVGTNGSNSGTSANTNGTVLLSSSNCAIAATSCYLVAHVGGIAGSTSRETGVISGCASQGTIQVNGTLADDGTYRCSPNVGGVVGYAASATISDSTSSCSVTVRDSFRYVNAGGLAGTALSTSIYNSSSSGNVLAYGGDNDGFLYEQVAAGGLIGLFHSTLPSKEIVNCFSTGNAEAQVKATGKQGYSFAGGLVGYVKQWTSPTSITGSYASGTAKAVALDNGVASSGGFAGYLQGAAVESCYSVGNAQSTAATGGYARAGGFAGIVVDATVTNGYSTGSSTSNCATKEYAGGFAGALAYTTFFKNVYSIGRPSVVGSGTTSAAGASFGFTTGTFTIWNVYYDSTVLPSIMNAVGEGAGATTGLSSTNMTANDVLSSTMSGFSAGGAWMKRANTATTNYYPELILFGNAGGSKEAASKNGVTLNLPTYTVTVVNGSGSGSYVAGAQVSVTANAAPAGQTFDRWTTDAGGSFLDAQSATTTFTVPANAVTITATYKTIPTNDSDPGTGSVPPITVVTAPSSMGGQASVEVAAVGNAFDQPVEVRMMDDAAAEQAVRQALREQSSLSSVADANIYPLDISIYIQGTNTKVQPKEGTSVQITCPVPQTLLGNKNNIVIVCVVDGKLTVLPTTVVEKGGKSYLQFTASHFSPYAFVVDTNGRLKALANGVGIPNTGDTATVQGGAFVVTALCVLALATGLRMGQKRKGLR
jgi:hypothetical protein